MSELDVVFLNSDFVEIYILDVYESLIWTDKYDEEGTFEIKNPNLTTDFMTALSETKYLSIADSDRLMILEDKDFKTGDITLTGRSIESFLSKRIVWDVTALVSPGLDIQSIIFQIIDKAFIDTDIPARHVDDFEFIESEDPRILAIDDKVYLFGENVYDVICALCFKHGLGWKLLREENKWRFYLYMGINRSLDQDEEPTVEFSDNLNNLISSRYIESTRPDKNTVLAAGAKGVGDVQEVYPVWRGGVEAYDLARNEIFLDTGISRNENGVALTDAEYEERITNAGYTKLRETIILKAFNGDVDTNMYKINEHFYLGDLVEVEDQFGHSGVSRAVSITFSNDVDGKLVYPTFIPIS